MIAALFVGLHAGEKFGGANRGRLQDDLPPCPSRTRPFASAAQGATSEASSAALLTLASQRLFGLAGMVVPENTP